MKRNYSLIILVFLFSFGFEYEMNDILSNYLHQGNLKGMALYFIALLIYIIPTIIFSIFISKKLKLSLYFLFFSITVGAFSIFFITGNINDLATKYAENNNFSDNNKQWLLSIVPAFFEEFLKGIVAILLFYTLKCKNIKYAILIGLGVGLGFQIIEDIWFLLNSNNQNDLIKNLINRISGAFASHWTYTTIFTTGAIGLLTKSKVFSYKYYVLFIVLPVLLHLIWNSPINNLFMTGIILTTINFYAFIWIFKYVLEYLNYDDNII